MKVLLQKKKKLNDGIPVEIFKIQKDDAVKVLHLICQIPHWGTKIPHVLGS